MSMPWVKDISRVKLRHLATQEQTFGGILDSPDISEVISSTYLRVRSNINDRPNHLIYHSVYLPVVLPLPPHSHFFTIYVAFCMSSIIKKDQQNTSISQL